jgi:hypothetical protein
MCRAVVGVALVSALALPAAAGEADWASAKRAYPLALIDRPLILPALMFQPTFAVEGTFVPGAYRSAGGVVGAGLDVGIVRRRLQAGFAVAAAVDPEPDFSLFIADVQIGLHDAVSLRFDAGMSRQLLDFSLDAEGIGIHTGFICGLGLPYKVKLHRMVALVGGSSSALGFGLPLPIQGPLSNFTVGLVLPNDLFSLFVADYGYAAGTVIAGSLFLPVGVLIQPIERLALGLHTGFRLNFTQSDRGSELFMFVPLSVAATVTVVRQLDLGLATTFLGAVQAQLGGWADDISLGFFVTGHL